jgi:hypothetical protein
MKTLDFEKLEKINGGSAACAWMYASFALVVVSAFAGPAGILVGAAWFARGVSSAYNCGSGR